jgi:hypothetical protein
VATAPETQIFAYYLDHFRRQWSHEQSGAGRPEGKAGLCRILTEADFEEMCRRAAVFVLDKIAARMPHAQVVVEKSPRHALHADFIARLFPDAYFLHVIRDPRDTVASLKAAGRTWGADWAPRNPIEGARMWVQHIECGRRLAGLPQYREVRYEDLRANPLLHLRETFAWLGIRRSAEVCEGYVRDCDLNVLRGGGGRGELPIPSERTPAGFFRRGVSGGWRQELRRHEIRTIEHICKQAMQELGYEAVMRTRGRPARIRMHDTLQRVRESIDWQLAKLQLRV